MTIGERIQLMLDAKGMKQSDLAKAAHVTATSVSRYVHNTRTPTLKELIKISDALGVTLDWLARGKEGTR